jgi:hypothetical protein
MNVNIFEAATRQKLRFTTNRGQISVEDLWDLSLEELDNVAKSANKQVKESSEESFIQKQSTADKKLSLRLDVVVSIINTKLEEQEKRKAAADRKVKRDQIMELISQKETTALGNKSLAALRAELDKLEEVEA